MNRRGLVVGIVLLAHMMIAGGAVAQDSPRPLSLADRLAELRKGWGDRRNNEQRHGNSHDAGSGTAATSNEPRQLAVQPPAPLVPTDSPRTSAARPYPRVNTSRLLPDDYSHLRRRDTETVPPLAAPGASAARTPSARTAALPERPDANSARDEAEAPQSLGDAYLAAPQTPPANSTERSAETTVVNPFKSAAPIRSGSTPSGSAVSSSNTADSRPSPSVRRSPKWTPPADFDPEELKRDLVDSNGRPLAGDNDRSSDETPALEPAPNEAEQALVGRLAPGDAPRDSDEPQTPDWPLEESTPLVSEWDTENQRETDQEPALSGTGIQSYGASPVTDADIPGSAPSAERVQREGQRVFGAPSASDAFTSDDGSRGAATSGEPFDNSGRSTFSRGRDGQPRNQSPASTGENVLVTNRMPMISSNVTGPRQILIGREAHYQLQLSNQSDTPAEQVVAQVHVPEWAEVVDTVASSGIIQLSDTPDQPNTFRWQISRLAAQGTETLDLKLIPRSSRPLELGVNWSYAPVGARAVVEVQEPKLRMTVSGPDEVLYGTPQLYRLSLSNPGTGVAENVQIHLLPPGGGEETVSSHSVGELAPGASKVVEVELTAREAGKLYVKASATAAGDISVDAAKEIFCRKAELEVDWRGPEQKYAGTAATYFFRVRNPGTAPANDVSVGVRLPDEAEFLSASEGQSYDPTQSTVVWRVGTLRPGDDYYMELKCLVNKAGINKFDIKAVARENDLVDFKTAETHVVALADLKLEVTDPKGPVPVGQDAVYEIRIRNRGTNTAEEVNVVALFSEGIDAESVEGAQYSIADGRVTFRTIDKLPAGGEILLKIRARASQPGTHVFRAEVLCRDLEIKLAAEETTRFYQDDSVHGLSESSTDAALRSDMFQDDNGSRY